MKFKCVIALICIAAMLLSGCAIKDMTGNKDDDIEDYSSQIASLEEKIYQIQSNYDIFNSERLTELEQLRLELDRLTEEKETSNASTTTTQGSNVFLYSQSDGKATINGYSGNDTYIAIPTEIDSYDVVKIGKNAFSSSKITCVVIGEGVESIDWFAFYNSPFLTEVTIPSSVKSIGYAAFDGCSPRLTIYCHKDSYAHSYAKSYGISYVII